MEIGKQIKEHRQRKGMSQQQLCVAAKMTGFSRFDISNFETGKRFPSRENLNKLCEALHVEITLTPIKTTT